MEFVLWILILVFEFAAIGDALRGALPIQRKILWSLLIVFLPFLGMIIYFLLGREERATT